MARARLEVGDGVRLLHGQPDVVEAFHQAAHAEGFDVELGHPPVPKFNNPAIAYVLASDLKKGDTVEVALVNGEGTLITNSETLTDDKETYLLQAGKRAVPAGGWPQEWKYSARVKITRDGKTLIEQSTDPIPFE